MSEQVSQTPATAPSGSHSSSPAEAGRGGAPAGAVGVLFDVDDTLVDLRTAMRRALMVAAEPDLHGLDDAQRERFAEAFSRDVEGYYDRYVAGELGFAQQRHLRLVAALTRWGRSTVSDPDAFSAVFEAEVVAGWRAFDDVHPVLDQLDLWNIPYGAVTNNLEAYQRNKLERSGLDRVSVVIGSDTAGAPKPDARSYLAGVSALGTAAGTTLMVGDNPGHDVAGAKTAGLPALLVDRFGRYPDQESVSGLTSVLDWASAFVGSTSSG
ncbi:MAG: HAD family hydrolase [Galactobacter sp.]